MALSPPGEGGFSGGIDAVDSNGSTFINILSTNNTGDGLRLGPNNTVRGCKSRQNNVHGFSFNGDATIIGCTADHNGGSGFLMASGAISDSSATNNNANGFESRRASFTHCLAHDNGASGFWDASSPARSKSKRRAHPTREKTADAPQGGSSAGSYFACVANANGGLGFELTAGPMTVNACTADGNVAVGIHAGGGSSVTNCTVSENSDEGIWVEDGSSVTGCTSRLNAFSGFSRTAIPAS